MSRREEIFAVMRERDAEAARAIVLADRLWYRPLLARWLRGEAKRLLALNERDLNKVPPARYHGPPAGGAADASHPPA